MKLLRIPFPLTFALAAIFLAVLAQFVYATQQKGDVALIFFAGAIMLWWGSLLTSPTQVARQENSVDAIADFQTSEVSENFGSLDNAHPRTISNWLIASGVGLAVLAYLFSGENQFTSDGVLAWVSSIAVLLYTFWSPVKTWDAWRAWFVARIDNVRAIFSDGARIPYRTILFVLILLIGAFFYFYKLDMVPAEMVSDHAEKILDIRGIVDGARPVYLLRNNGSEPMWSYFVAMLVALFNRPLDFATLKFVSALFGWLFIPTLFFLARECFDDDVALIATAFVTIATWSLGIVRAGLPFATTPLFVALLLLFLVRSIKRQHRNDSLMAGIVLGAGFYASESFRIAPILAIVFLVTAFLFIRSVRQNWRVFFQNSILLFVVSFAVLAPLVRFADDNLEFFFLHTTARIGNDPFSIGTFLRNMVNALLMFNARGDASWLTTVPDAPTLDYVMGGLFILGIALALYRLVKSRELAHAFLFLGLIVLLIPSAISLANPDDNPSAVYAAGALPIVLIFVALACTWGIRVIANALNSESRWLAIGAFIVVLFAVSARANYASYFDAFDLSYRKASWNASEMSEMARGFSQSIGDASHVWLIAYPYWVDARNVSINDENGIQLLPSADAAIAHAGDPFPKLYMLNIGDQANLVRLREIYPNGQERAYHSRTPNHDFILFYTMGIPNR